MEKNSRIFLLGIHTDLKKTEIIDFFKKEYPSVTNCCLIHSKKFKKKTNNVGYGTLFLKSEEETKQILSKRQFTLKGRNFVVKPYYKGKKLKDFKSSVHKRRIYVNNIEPDMENQQLREVFEKYGQVEDAYIVKNDKFEGFKRIGFVVFEKIEQAEKIIEMETISIHNPETKLGVFRYKSEKVRNEEKKDVKKKKKRKKPKKKNRQKSNGEINSGRTDLHEAHQRTGYVTERQSGGQSYREEQPNGHCKPQIKIEANGAQGISTSGAVSKKTDEENLKISSKNLKGTPNAKETVSNKLKFNPDSPAFYQPVEIANNLNAALGMKAISGQLLPTWYAPRDQRFLKRKNQFTGETGVRQHQNTLSNGRRGYFFGERRGIIEVESQEFVTKNVHHTLKFVASLYDHRSSNLRFN